MLARGQEGVAAPLPTVSVSAQAELLDDVLAKLRDETHIMIAAVPFTGQRRVTVDVKDKPLTEALDELAKCSVASWDAGYILVHNDGPHGPAAQPPGWQTPPQTKLTLSGGTGSADQITTALTNLSCAPVGYAPDVAPLVLTTQPATDAPLETVLSAVKGDHLTWTRGFWLAPIDRAAVFGRYAHLPPEECEQRVLRHVEQMMRLNKDDVRQALEARHREVAGMTTATREAEIQRYADEIRAGITVLNTLSPEVRDKAREAMQIFFEIGLQVYRDLTEDEQLEATPIIEAMGELHR
jgi:hypothetical protein